MLLLGYKTPEEIVRSLFHDSIGAHDLATLVIGATIFPFYDYSLWNCTRLNKWLVVPKLFLMSSFSVCVCLPLLLSILLDIRNVDI